MQPSPEAALELLGQVAPLGRRRAGEEAVEVGVARHTVDSRDAARRKAHALGVGSGCREGKLRGGSVVLDEGCSHGSITPRVATSGSACLKGREGLRRRQNNAPRAGRRPCRRPAFAT